MLAHIKMVFRGRTDVVAERFEFKNERGETAAGYRPMCANRCTGVCPKVEDGSIKCGSCPGQAYVPLSDELLKAHLEGPRVSRHISAAA